MIPAIIARLERGNVNPITVRIIASSLGLCGKAESPDAGRPTAPRRANTDTGSAAQVNAAHGAGMGRME